jgi:hypothetical protein
MMSDPDPLHDIGNLLSELAGKEKNIRFSRLLKICEDVFGGSRISGGHHIFKTPWPGDRRINLQKAGNMAKPYQVKQVIESLKKFRSITK